MLYFKTSKYLFSQTEYRVLHVHVYNLIIINKRTILSHIFLYCSYFPYALSALPQKWDLGSFELQLVGDNSPDSSVVVVIDGDGS